jgi:hypothetical protein
VRHKVGASDDVEPIGRKLRERALVRSRPQDIHDVSDKVDWYFKASQPKFGLDVVWFTFALAANKPGEVVRTLAHQGNPLTLQPKLSKPGLFLWPRLSWRPHHHFGASPLQSLFKHNGRKKLLRAVDVSQKPVSSFEVSSAAPLATTIGKATN